MPLICFTKAAKARILAEVTSWCEDQAPANASVVCADTAAQLDKEQYIPASQAPGAAFVTLPCGLVFMVQPHEMYIDTTRGKIAPAPPALLKARQ